jgi:autotransporter translocation and assembly factor TamB
MVTTTYYAEETRPRRRRGRRALITLLVLLIVVVGLLIVGDRVAANFAEKKIAEQVSQEVAAQNAQAAPPEVSVGGFPFLTQVLAGKYEKITIVMRDVKGDVNGDSVSLPKLDVVAHDVSASLDTLRSGQGDVVAKTVDGTGTISYDSVTGLIDQPGLTLSEREGKLVASAPVEVLGQRFTVKGSAELAVKGKQIQIRFADATAEGLPAVPLAQQVVGNFIKQISINVDVPTLPFQMVLKEVHATPEGLAVTATANDVPISS